MRRCTQSARNIATFILIAASAITRAQDAPTGQSTPATRPATRAAAVVPTTQPASTQPTTIPSRISLNFKDTPLDNVLDFLSRTLGFEVLKDGPIDARVNISSRQPVTPEEAITLVNAALKANGFVVVREGRMLHVSLREKAKKANVPVHFGSDPADVAETDELITQVIPIKNVNAGKLKDDLKPMLPDADLISNEGSNTIIITDASATVHRLVLIIRKLDDHEAETSEIRIIPLKHANAAAVAKIIDTFFKSSGGGGGPQQPQPGMPMVMGPNGQPMPQKGGGGGSERHGNTVITAADDRTNTLLVMASGEALKSIENIVARMDNADPNPAPGAVMRAFPLKYAIAEDTAKLINTVFKNQQDNNYSPYIIRIFGGGGEDQKKDWKINAAFDERTNTLIVTGSKEAIAAVEELIKILDANQVAPAELKVFHLKHADAFIVAGQLEEMFKPKEEQNNRFPFLIFSEAPAPPGRLMKLHVTSDDRTNTVIVTAPAEMMKPIGEVIQDLDADPSTEDTLFIYHLRNAQADNLELVLNMLFGNIQNGQNPNQQNQNGQNQNQQQNQNRFGPDQGNNNNQNNQNNQNNRNGNRNNNRRNRNQQQGMPNMSQNIAHAVNELTGKVFVVADLDTNSLMVTTASKYERQVRMIIEDLDRPVPQVLIKVLVAEVSHDNSADLGVDFSVLDQRNAGKVQTRGQNANQTFGTPGSGLIVSMLESQLNLTLHALAQQNKLDVLSRPYILASDNQLANIFIGSNVPFVTFTQITESGQLINTVQNRDIGLNLSVTPHINPDGMVILDVSEEIQQLTAQQVPISNTTFSPVIAKRSADSRIGVMNNQTIVIGGLMEDRKTDTINKIPILGDIPGLGMLFRRTQTTKTKTELLIFLTPHVAQEPSDLQPMSNDEMKGTRLTPNAVSPGTFQEQMNGMRRGQSPQTQPIGPISPVNSIDLSDPSGKPREPDPTTQPGR
jgi:general secretion pathway protein D